MVARALSTLTKEIVRISLIRNIESLLCLGMPVSLTCISYIRKTKSCFFHAMELDDEHFGYVFSIDAKFKEAYEHGKVVAFDTTI